jgi:CHC2 zinc finger
MVKFSAKIFVDKLKLDLRQDRHVIRCPFHLDAATDSLSINLAQATFYCFGACREPKGGGPVEFILKWARYVDKKPLVDRYGRDDKSQARALLRNETRTPDAREQRLDTMKEEIDLFREYAYPRFAARCKAIERAIADIDTYCADWPKQRLDEEIWTLLATCHRELQWCEQAFAALTPRRGVSNLTPEIIHIFSECERRGWWTLTTRVHMNRVRDQRRHARYLDQQLEV